MSEKNTYLPPSFVYDMRTRSEIEYDAHQQMHDDACCPENCLVCEEELANEKSCPICGSTETEQDWNGNLRCAQCGK